VSSHDYHEVLVCKLVANFFYFKHSNTYNNLMKSQLTSKESQ